MRRVMRVGAKAAAVLVAAGSLTTAGLVGTAQAATSTTASQCKDNGTTDGCVHLYMNNGKRYSWYHYGSHNISVSGTGVLLNTQTGGAVAYYCTKTNGNGTCKLVRAGDAVVGNFSGIKSIYMSAKPTS